MGLELPDEALTGRGWHRTWRRATQTAKQTFCPMVSHSGSSVIVAFFMSTRMSSASKLKAALGFSRTSTLAKDDLRRL
jgi:hypothetical protein